MKHATPQAKSTLQQRIAPLVNNVQLMALKHQLTLDTTRPKV